MNILSVLSVLDITSVKKYLERLNGSIIERDGRVKSILSLRKLVKIYVESNKTLLEPPVWIYMGLLNDHIIIPKLYCSCKDYIIRVMSEKRRPACIHLIAQKFAEEKKSYKTVTVSLNDYFKILSEILKYGKSPTLRKVLYGIKP